jgi:hypothetical protein
MRQVPAPAEDRKFVVGRHDPHLGVKTLSVRGQHHRVSCGHVNKRARFRRCIRKAELVADDHRTV